MEEYKAQLDSIEQEIRAKVEKEMLPYASHFPSRKEFKERQERIIEEHLIDVKDEIYKEQIKVLRLKQVKMREELKSMEDETSEYEHEMNNGMRSFLSYLSSIEKPLEKTLNQQIQKVTKVLDNRMDESLAIMEHLLVYIKETPAKVAVIKAAAAEKILEIENEIAASEKRYAELDAQEQAYQKEINAVEASIEKELKTNEIFKMTQAEAIENEEKCKALQQEMENINAQVELDIKALAEIQAKREEVEKTNMELTEKVSNLENQLQLLRRENAHSKSVCANNDKKIKHLKSKAGMKRTLEEIEADNNYEDVVASVGYQLEKQKMIKLKAEGEAIQRDIKNVQTKNEQDRASLTELEAQLATFSEILSTLEAELQQMEEKNEEKLAEQQALMKNSEDLATQNAETIASLKQEFAEKSAQKKKLETTLKKLEGIQKKVLDASKKEEEEEKKKKQQQLQQEVEPKRKNPRRSNNSHQTFTVNKNDAGNRPDTPLPPSVRASLDSTSEVDYEFYRPAYMAQQRFDFPDIALVGETDPNYGETDSVFDGGESVAFDMSVIDTDEEF